MDTVELIGPITRETSPDYYVHLFDKQIYKRSAKGAGYKKLKIFQLNLMPKDPNTGLRDVKVKLIDRSVSKNSIISLYISYVNNDLNFYEPYYFESALKYFLWVESSNHLFKQVQRRKPQYIYEFKQIREKYPEYFL